MALGVCESSGVGKVRPLDALDIVKIKIQNCCRTIAPNSPRPRSFNLLSIDCILTAPPRKVAKHSSEAYSSVSTHDQCSSFLWMDCISPLPATMARIPRLAKRRNVTRPGILLACHQAMVDNDSESRERRCIIGF